MDKMMMKTKDMMMIREKMEKMKKKNKKMVEMAMKMKGKRK